MKHLAISQIILCILMLIIIFTTNELRKRDQEIIVLVKMLETRQAQLTLQVCGGWEPVDLTYLPRIARNPELKEKE
jgi:hypothetical protein